MAARPRKIVVGYDGSGAAERALDAAADLAGYGSTLTVVSVSSNGSLAAGSHLAEAHERLLARHVTASYLRPVGDPAHELLSTARAIGADLLVVGRRDAGDGAPAPLGPVSDEIVRRAACDVLVVAR